MAQDADKVVLASSQSSVKDVECFPSDPAVFTAGLCVRVASTGELSVAKAAGMLAGVSKGRSLADTKKTDVLRAGLRVPVQAHLKRATGIVTITDFAALLTGGADTLEVAGVVFTPQAGAATTGTATFQAASSNNATATSLAAQINAHATAGALVRAIASAAVVTIYAVAEGVAGNAIEVIYDNLHDGAGIVLSGITDDKLTGGSDSISDIAYMVVGSKMYINDITGKADVAMTGFTTITDAIYVDGPKEGYTEAGTIVAAGLVDMVGGL